MIERKKWVSTSPSQLSTFRDCKRKWFRVSVLGERPPSSPAAERGTRIHEQIEQWLMNGVAPTDGTARAMLRHLPPGGSVSPDHVEQAFDLTPPGWVARVRGRIDLIDPSTNQIIDHKSTASLNYAKTQQDLETDTQAIIYSSVALSGSLGIEFDEPLKFTLSYGTTRGPVKTSLVSRRFTRAQLAEPLARIGEEVSEQQSTSQALEWSEVAPNYQSCDKYGGCAFRHDCTRAAQRATVTAPEPSSKDVRAFMSALKGDGQAQASNVIQIEARPALETNDELDEDGECYRQTNPPDGLPDREPLPEDQRPSQRLPRFRWNGKSLSAMRAADRVQAIQELTGVMSAQARAAYETHTEHLTADTMSANKERLEVIHKINYGLITVADTPEPPMSTNDFFGLFAETAPEPIQESAPESAPEPIQESAPEPIQESAPEPIQESAPEPIQESAPEPIQESAPEPIQESAPEPAWVTEDLTLKPEHYAPNILLIDAVATTGESSHMLDELAPLIKDIERQHQRPISMIPYDEGWKILGSRLTSWGFRKNIITIDSSHPLYRHCSHALLALADIVVRGTR